MATNGSYSTNKYTLSSNKTIGLNLSWSLKSQSIANNTSTLSWTLKSNGSLSSEGYVWAGPVTCKIHQSTVVHTTSRFKMYGSGDYKKTGTVTITHDADGSKKVTMSVKAALYDSSVNCEVTKSGIPLPTITRYAQISSVTDFTNNPSRDGYPTIVYTNPAGTTLTTGLKCRLTWNDGANYTDWVTLNDEGGEYTFTSSTLTAANITSMLNACPNSSTLAVTCELQSTFNSVDGSVTKAAIMDVVDSFPHVERMSYSDIDSSIVAKTGDASIIVQRQSTLRIQIPTPTALNGASIASGIIRINGTDYNLLVGSGIYYYDFVQPSLSGTFSTEIIIVDSRGFGTKSIDYIVIQPWEAPTALYTLARVSGFETNTALYVSGTVSSVSGTNTMSITEQHKQVGTSIWSAATTIPNETSTTISLDNTYAWDVLITVHDKYTTTGYMSTVEKGIPMIFMDKNRNSLSVNGYPDANNQIYVDGTVKATGLVAAKGVNLPNIQSSTEHIIGYWTDGTTPVYEKTVELSSTVTAAAGNTSAAGAWTVLQTGWTDPILPIEFFAWNVGGTDPTLWTHLTVQWERNNARLRVLNIRSTAANIDGFLIRYIYVT